MTRHILAVAENSAPWIARRQRHSGVPHESDSVASDAAWTGSFAMMPRHCLTRRCVVNHVGNDAETRLRRVRLRRIQLARVGGRRRYSRPDGVTGAADPSSSDTSISHTASLYGDLQDTTTEEFERWLHTAVPLVWCI